MHDHNRILIVFDHGFQEEYESRRAAEIEIRKAEEEKKQAEERKRLEKEKRLEEEHKAEEERTARLSRQDDVGAPQFEEWPIFT